MTKQQAQTYLLIGYGIFIAGFLFGSFFDHYSDFSPFVTHLIMGYSLWSIYHGYHLVHKSVSSFFGFKGVALYTNSVFELIRKQLIINSVRRIITLIFSYFVGLFGGAIYQQIRWSQVAYR